MSDNTTLPVPAARASLTRLDQLAAIPEEEIWLAKQKSAQTRRAYKLDVRHFMIFMNMTGTADLLPRGQGGANRLVAFSKHKRTTNAESQLVL